MEWLTQGHTAKKTQSQGSRCCRSSPSPDLSPLGVHALPNPMTCNHSGRRVHSASWSAGHSAPKACLCGLPGADQPRQEAACLSPAPGATPVMGVCAIQISTPCFKKKKKKAITWGWSQVSVMSPVSYPGRPCDPCDSACSQALRPSAHSSDAALQRTSVLRASATQRQAGARQPSLGGSHTRLPALTPTLARGTVSRMRDADMP